MDASRPRTIIRALNHAIGDWTHIQISLEHCVETARAERKKGASSMKNRIIGKSFGIIRRRERNAGQCVNSSSLLMLQFRRSATVFLFSISLYRFAVFLTRFALLPMKKKKNSYQQMSTFSHNSLVIYIVNRSYTILSNCATSNDISILAKRALRKKGIVILYMTFRVRTRAAFSFHFFFFLSFCNRFGDP